MILAPRRLTKVRHCDFYPLRASYSNPMPLKNLFASLVLIIPVAAFAEDAKPPSALPAPSGPASDPFPSATPQAVVAVTSKVFPSVVRIDVAQEVYAEGK